LKDAADEGTAVEETLTGASGEGKILITGLPEDYTAFMLEGFFSMNLGPIKQAVGPEDPAVVL
jgi:hypothetical protein